MNKPVRRLGLAALLCVAWVVAPFLSDACLAADTAEGNTVTVDGTVVTIHVHVDVVLRPDLVDEESVALFAKLQDGINAYWNSAFDALRYRDCLRLKVDVVLTVVALDNIGLASAPGDYIKVTTTPGHHVMIFAIGSQDAPDYLPRPAVVDPYGPKAAPGEDYVSPFQHDLDGTWANDMEPSRDFAHEIGHLLGLGDDYRNVPAARGAAGTESLDGREGTLMDSGDYIDQNIVDRVGKLIEKAGNQLPTCWKGTWSQDSNRSYRVATTGAEVMKCDDKWDGTVSFAERSDGVLDGTAIAKLTSGFSCTLDQGRSSVARVKQITYGVGGRKTATGFELHFKFDHNTPMGANMGGNQMLLGLHICENAEADPPPVLLERGTADNVASGRFTATGSPFCGGSKSDVATVDAHLEVTRQ